MWRSKNAQRGKAPTAFLRSLAAVRRRTVTDLLSEVGAYIIAYILILNPNATIPTNKYNIKNILEIIIYGILLEEYLNKK
jgi:hypothetical protein